MRKLLTGALVLLGFALTACGETPTDTASSPASTETAATVNTTPETPPTPTVEVAWVGPKTTTRNQATLKGTVTYGAHVKVAGQRAAVVGTTWSKVVKTSKHGKNAFSVVATKKGHNSSKVDAAVTRQLTTAERAELRREAQARREKAAARRAELRREAAARRAGARALESAESYLESGSFSKQGLYEQLSSSSGEGFTEAEAQYAIDHVGSPWKKEAVQSAKSYLATSSFSRSGLIEQLSSSAGEGFTYAEAVYAVNKVY